MADLASAKVLKEKNGKETPKKRKKKEKEVKTYKRVIDRHS